MARYIGLDAHASSCTLAVLGPSGQRLGSHVVETNTNALIEVLGAIPSPRHLCFEEGTLANWLHEMLAPHVEQCVVAAVRARVAARRTISGMRWRWRRRSDSVRCSGRYTKVRGPSAAYDTG